MSGSGNERGPGLLRYCPGCGARLRGNEAFCGRCGMRLQGAGRHPDPKRYPDRQGYPDRQRYPNAQGYPDRQRYPDAQGYPDRQRYPDAQEYQNRPVIQGGFFERARDRISRMTPMELEDYRKKVRNAIILSIVEGIAGLFMLMFALITYIDDQHRYFGFAYRGFLSWSDHEFSVVIIGLIGAVLLIISVIFYVINSEIRKML